MSGAVMAASLRGGTARAGGRQAASASRWPADVFVVGGSLTGFFWLIQRAIADMATRCGGHVLSVLATLGEVADPGMPAVLAALANGGLTAATGSLAIEYAAYGIRVNAISPGRAGQVRSATSWTACCSWSSRPASSARSGASTAPRMGRPQAVKPLVRPSARLIQAAPTRRAARGGSLYRAW